MILPGISLFIGNLPGRKSNDGIGRDHEIGKGEVLPIGTVKLKK